MPLGNPTDEDLIARIMRAEPAAARILYSRYGRLVYSLARQVVGDAAAAEEVTQDVFLLVWEKAGTYRAEKARVATWIARIARNRAIDVLRQQRSRDTRSKGAWEELKKAAEAPAPDAGDVMETERLRARVREAVASLPEDQKAALMLAYFRGLTHQEIAAQLGEPLGTIKTRIRAGMQKLRGMLEGGVE
jgi:RNA polymerase sigma-70 factor (ECF subfamily)